MADDVEQLVSEITAAIGTAPPEVMGDDAPVPVEADGELYYVGLIGGKDVGKTSLVNAIVGATIAEPTGHGEGTRAAVAYAHFSALAEVRRKLGDIEIVPHHTEYLRRQVLLDLPDIDSKYADHVSLTRQMLRHMLYPIWVQSVEKYADQRPQALLRQVAAGNDPGNFLFLLNKVDQLIDRDGLQAAGELAEDYSTRLAKLLKLMVAPEVMLVSAIRPGEYDLPMLRKRLGVQRSPKQVEHSRQLAQRRRTRSIVEWVEKQDLPARAEAAQRLLDDGGDLVAERLGVPILEDALPHLEQDAAHRLSLAEPAVKARLRAWPIVNVIDALASPLISLVRRNLAPAGGEMAALDACLSADGRSIARGVQAVFAQLNNAYAEVNGLYARRRLWETPDAENAAADLRARLAGALEAQRAAVAEHLRPRGWAAPWRWLLTVGAAAWFILLQPIVDTALRMAQFDWRALLVRFVEIFSASMLLTNVGFVIVYLLVLWIGLRISTTRRVASWRWRMMSEKADDPSVSLPAQTVLWMQSLLRPLGGRHEELSGLAARAAVFRAELDQHGPSAKPTAEAA